MKLAAFLPLLAAVAALTCASAQTITISTLVSQGGRCSKGGEYALRDQMKTVTYPEEVFELFTPDDVLIGNGMVTSSGNITVVSSFTGMCLAEPLTSACTCRTFATAASAQTANTVCHINVAGGGVEVCTGVYEYNLAE